MEEPTCLPQLARPSLHLLLLLALLQPYWADATLLLLLLLLVVVVLLLCLSVMVPRLPLLLQPPLAMPPLGLLPLLLMHVLMMLPGRQRRQVAPGTQQPAWTYAPPNAVHPQ